jgi:hypothetical protein
MLSCACTVKYYSGIALVSINFCCKYIQNLYGIVNHPLEPAEFIFGL